MLWTWVIVILELELLNQLTLMVRKILGRSVEMEIQKSVDFPLGGSYCFFQTSLDSTVEVAGGQSVCLFLSTESFPEYLGCSEPLKRKMAKILGIQVDWCRC